MSSHAHLIISAVNLQKINLSDIIRDLKKFTAAQDIRKIEADAESRQEWLLDRLRFADGKNSRNAT